MNLNQCHNIEALEGLRSLASESINLIVTDPPYNIELDIILQKKFKDNRYNKKESNISYTEIKLDYGKLAREMFRVLQNNSHCYIFCADNQLVEWIPALTTAGFNFKQTLIWTKNKQSIFSQYKFPYRHEIILFVAKGDKKLNYNGELTPSTLLNYKIPFIRRHPCQRPINLIKFLTVSSSVKGDICLDCFVGSGTHLIAFKTLDRKFIGFEISAEYCKSIDKYLNENDLKQWF